MTWRRYVSPQRHNFSLCQHGVNLWRRTSQCVATVHLHIVILLTGAIGSNLHASLTSEMPRPTQALQIDYRSPDIEIGFFKSELLAVSNGYFGISLYSGDSS
jgi:hypothetical protein